MKLFGVLFYFIHYLNRHNETMTQVGLIRLSIFQTVFLISLNVYEAVLVILLLNGFDIGLLAYGEYKFFLGGGMLLFFLSAMFLLPKTKLIKDSLNLKFEEKKRKFYTKLVIAYIVCTLLFVFFMPLFKV